MTGTPTFYKVSRKKELKCYEVGMQDLQHLVAIGFADDPELLEKYQELDTDFHTTVQRNISRIEEYNSINTLTIYELRYGIFIVGFMALDLNENLLYSFGINGKYRKASIVSAWVDFIKCKFNNLFSCVLFNKNERAINFLVRNGMKVVEKTDSLTSLTYNKWQ